VPLFQKRPIVIDARQFKGGPMPGVYFDDSSQAHVVTIHGQECRVVPGDWIVPEPDGVHFYPVKADVFAATYDAVGLAGPDGGQALAGPESWLVLKAALLAAEAHDGTFRDDGKTPYVLHPLAVARDVAAVAAGLAPGVLEVPASWAVAGAVLHDVLEDCKPREAWADRIGAGCGDGVLRIVWQLTNPSKDCPKGTPRADKKAIDCHHYRDPRAVGRPARLVKLVDRTHNLRDMRGEKWRKGTLAAQYVKESADLLDAVLAGLRGTHGHGPEHEAAFAPLVAGYLEAMAAASAPVLVPQPPPGPWRGCDECSGGD
jgi:hypothetical protein